MLNFDRIAAAQAVHTPFSYFSTEHVLDLKALASLARDFPILDGPGLFTLDGLSCGPRFDQLIADLRHPGFTRLMEEKFEVDLSDKPLMITVRGFCQKKDGRIHVDSTDKVVTGLLYLNEPHWTKDGGRLRLLNGPDSLDDPIAEVPPNGGTMLVFRRSEVSWHGHAPYEGPRRAVMFNWMRSGAVMSKNLLRHRVSAFVKRGLAVGY